MNRNRNLFIGFALIFPLVFYCGCHEQKGDSGVATDSLTTDPLLSASVDVRKVVQSAVEQTRYTRRYDPAYVEIDYPRGDVPQDRGVCADVIVRAFRHAGVDLQQTVHEDMVGGFSAYPKLWGLKKPDANIDHRRVANLMTYFKRKGYAQEITSNTEDYHPGDIVAWELPNGRLHIGIVSNLQLKSVKRYCMVHNIGAGTRTEDVLFNWPIIGHYRCFK